MLALLAAITLRKPVSVDQLIIFLTFLFPSFACCAKEWKQKFLFEFTREKEISVIEMDNQKKYKINEIMFQRVVKNLKIFTNMPQNLKLVKDALFDNTCIGVIHPGVLGPI